MKVLSVLNSLKISDGGPPEVLRNQLSVINRKKKICLNIKIKNDFGILFTKVYI